MFKKIYIFLIISFLFSFKLYAQDIQKDLLDLKNLFEAGVLNEEEYNSARKIIEEKGYKEKVIESKKKIEIKKEEIKITKEVEKTKEDLSAKLLFILSKRYVFFLPPPHTNHLLF